MAATTDPAPPEEEPVSTGERLESIRDALPIIPATAQAAAANEEPEGDVAGVAAVIEPAGGSDDSSLLLVVLFASLGIAVLLLGVAAVPPWALRTPRASEVLSTYRVQIAAAGLSALCAAAVVLLINTSVL